MKLLIWSCLFFLAPALGAQTTIGPDQLDTRSRKAYKKAIKAIDENDTERAVALLSDIKTQYPSFYEGLYRLGWQQLKMDNRDKARQSFQQALDLVEEPDGKLVDRLAYLYEEIKAYDEALSAFNKLEKSMNKQDRLYNYVERRIDELGFRQKAYSNPLDIDIEVLGPEINGPWGDYLPSIDATGSNLVFTKRLPLGDGSLYRNATQEDLYMAKLDDSGHFEKAQPIAELNTSANEGGHCFSQDGTTLIFTACDRMGGQSGCDLNISFLKSGRWTEPQNMGSKINSRYWESQPSLSHDNRTLYFSSTRKGGFGQKDIWKVERTERGWTDPVNLGPAVNTADNEECPFIHADNQTLYFRSDGHVGMGGFDLFMTKKKNNKWQNPQNLGYPINSDGDEGALFVDLAGHWAYYASDSFNDDNNLDIVRFELPPALKPQPASYIEFIVRDNEDNQPLMARIDMLIIAEDTYKKSVTTDKKGGAMSIVTLGEYLVNIKKPGYLMYSEHIDIDTVFKLKDPFKKEIYLQAVPQDTLSETTPVVLRNIFFDSGSASLMTKSDHEIEGLLELITNDPSLHITIVGHTDNVGDEDDNLELSRARAKAVFNALVDRGADPAQLSFKGMGESRPLVPNTNPENRAVNRRTEFIAERHP